MAIKIDILKEVDSTRSNTSVYSDIKLDLQLNRTLSNELHKNLQITDVQSDKNESAIKNSITNIIMTTPGEKILNPMFGCSFGDILFMPISDSRARLIAQSILTSITRFEPRVKVININVTPYIDEGQYQIEFTLQIPRFNVNQVKYTGIISKSGFYMS